LSPAKTVGVLVKLRRREVQEFRQWSAPLDLLKPLLGLPPLQQRVHCQPPEILLVLAAVLLGTEVHLAPQPPQQGNGLPAELTDAWVHWDCS
jgi:hypothetical protein